MKKYRIVYRTRVLYDWTKLSLGIDSISLKYLYHNENNVVLNEKSVEGKPCLNRESMIPDLKMYLYICYDEHEAPSSCNTNVYLSQFTNVS